MSGRANGQRTAERTASERPSERPANGRVMRPSRFAHASRLTGCSYRPERQVSAPRTFSPSRLLLSGSVLVAICSKTDPECQQEPKYASLSGAGLCTSWPSRRPIRILPTISAISRSVLRPSGLHRHLFGVLTRSDPGSRPPGFLDPGPAPRRPMRVCSPGSLWMLLL